jgi:hypothetical protein
VGVAGSALNSRVVAETIGRYFLAGVSKPDNCPSDYGHELPETLRQSLSPRGRSVKERVRLRLAQTTLPFRSAPGPAGKSRGTLRNVREHASVSDPISRLSLSRPML